MGGGLERDYGPSMVFRVGGIDIICITNNGQAVDLGQFTSLGIDPTRYTTVCVKSMQHFRAAFEPIAREVILVDTGALCSEHYTPELFDKARRPVWPRPDRINAVQLVGEQKQRTDDYLVDPKLSPLDKTRIQAQILVPLLRTLRSELGRERADALVRQALRGWSKQLFAAIGDGVAGSPRRKWAAMHTAMAEMTERDVTVEMHRHDKEALEFDITHCRFAEFFRALDEPELGALLICETDFDIAAAGGSDVTFTRDQTIMQGAASCTFRYKFAPR